MGGGCFEHANATQPHCSPRDAIRVQVFPWNWLYYLPPGMGGSASKNAADRYKRMTDGDSDRQPVEMKSVSSRFSFGGAAHRRKGGGAHGHGHHNPVLDAANEKKYQSLNYDEVHSGTFYKEVVHSKHEKIAEIKRCVV